MPDIAAPGARIVCRDAEWLVKTASRPEADQMGKALKTSATLEDLLTDVVFALLQERDPNARLAADTLLHQEHI